MECTVSWTAAAGTRSGMGFVAETGSGHVLVMDGAPDAANPANGGQNLAPRPMETVLAGTGGCTAVAAAGQAACCQRRLPCQPTVLAASPTSTMHPAPHALTHAAR